MPPRSRQRHPAPGTKAAPAPTRAADALLTLAEVTAELKVARSTFDTWRTLGTAPECIKLPNGQIRIRRSRLDAWLAARVELAEAG